MSEATKAVWDLFGFLLGCGACWGVATLMVAGFLHCLSGIKDIWSGP